MRHPPMGPVDRSYSLRTCSGGFSSISSSDSSALRSTHSSALPLKASGGCCSCCSSSGSPADCARLGVKSREPACTAQQAAQHSYPPRTLIYKQLQPRNSHPPVAQQVGGRVLHWHRLRWGGGGSGRRLALHHQRPPLLHCRRVICLAACSAWRRALEAQATGQAQVSSTTHALQPPPHPSSARAAPAVCRIVACCCDSWCCRVGECTPPAEA